MRGRFISLEGGEGAGKSTQLKQLAQSLRARGLDVVETREPGGSRGAEAIRTLLLQGEQERWSPRAEALLFAAARADHVERLISPALERGQWVLCDRFLDSSIAYQGGAGGIGKDAIMELHRIGSCGLLPDRTLLLELPPEAAAARARQRDGGEADRIGARNARYHAKVAAAFAALAQAEADRFRRIDATGDADQVTERLIAAIADFL
ncbi:dTMP kinase [Sphingosinicella rhizophila]|uniref:Thymidylate kinase n=1 Tax=Sphingosinicella rhizophila TaxID=3050082 RepID=A0ABU3Q2P1_9SPHN|nr:dTMP kinase [Sphingosinicella sp. GR2756]MDT9597665.1 dTMP kinase [Sphingosinicella sp. GR2756]